MINKYTSIKTVIAKVLTDLDIKEGDHKINDMIEWSGEALEKIGAFQYFDVKVTGANNSPYLELTDYQTKLPLDCHNVLQVTYATSNGGVTTPMRYSTGIFEYSKNMVEADVNTDYLFTDSDLVKLCEDVYSLTYAEALNKINTEPTTKQLLTNMLLTKASANSTSSYQDLNPRSYTYVINGGYIKTNMRDGFLCVAYQSIPLDVDGYPLIPDSISFIEAVYWYITMKLKFPEWMDGRLRDAVYYRIENKWNYYRKQAYGEAMMPNYDQMESIKNVWNRWLPDMNSHSTGQAFIGDREVIYNHTNTRY